VKAGDIVRFRTPTKQSKKGAFVWDWKLGLLVKYNTWEKIATILCEGRLIRIRASDVQKAGKRGCAI